MPSQKLIARLNCSINTSDFANMNLDCIVLNNQPEKGCYLLAVGQDKVSFFSFYFIL
jgi:hypothetical protein